MKYKLRLVITVLMIVAGYTGLPQDTPSVRYQVAVFTPLYLDSAFDETTSYRYGKAFPKFINPGLEFYEGIQLAADSLATEGKSMDLYVYDSRSATEDIANIVKSPTFDSIDLVIGHVNAKEAKMVANAVAKKNIPFINATYPNDAGVSNNPNYVILNSTLATHFTAIYKFIQKTYPLAPVVLFRKRGNQEDRIQKIFENINKNTVSVPLKIKYVTLHDNFTSKDLKAHLDEELTTAAIAGSLDVSFAEQLTAELASLYDATPSVVFGMPTWWDVTDFSRPEYKNIEVFYTTPFYVSETDILGSAIIQDYKTKYYSRPTDMFFRGFETLYHFANLLHLHGKNLGSSLSDRRSKLFTDFDIQPVLNPKTNTLDYFENKKIYFIKKVNGAEIAVY